MQTQIESGSESDTHILAYAIYSTVAQLKTFAKQDLNFTKMICVKPVATIVGEY